MDSIGFYGGPYVGFESIDKTSLATAFCTNCTYPKSYSIQWLPKRKWIYNS